VEKEVRMAKENLLILKASAGSGKTYSLAKNYIELLLEKDESKDGKKADPYKYKHILAVTFTNKATDEMKGRILKELHVLATKTDESPYLEDILKKGEYKNAAEVGKAAEVLLCNILHDYSAFAVSTIDRFFQQTLKAFSREIGHFASYQVELDRNSLVEEAVDRMLDSLTEKDKSLLDWLTTNTIESLEDGGKYKLEALLHDVAKRLKSEEFKNKIEQHKIDEQEMYSAQALETLKKACDKIVDDFVAEVRAISKKIVDHFNSSGVDLEDTNRGFLKVFKDYPTWKKSDLLEKPSDNIMSNSPNPEKWFAQTKKNLKDKVGDYPQGYFQNFVDLINSSYKKYYTAFLLRKQILGFGIIENLRKEFDAILKEKNVLSLDDTNTILKDIIDGTETPFIYEKLGVKFNHFLLDEFQDTSHVQWDNFRPLLMNSMDENKFNLIVGDVKQSIYRFRNSDWNLLDSQVQKDFCERRVKDDSLKSNFRSAKAIVDFNNDFFLKVAPFLDSHLGDDKDAKGSITQIYSDVKQLVGSKTTLKGSVDYEFSDSIKGQKDDQPERVYQAVMKAREAGYAFKDIAVLVRYNRHGAEFASYLISKGVNVVTDDSLRVSSSITVKRLAALLTGIDNPCDKIASFMTASLNIKAPEAYHSLVDLAEELLRALRIYDEQTFESEVLYIQSFMDILRDFVSKNGNALHDFLEEWKSNKSSISSPSLGDSVRIITVHKSKGLAFPYVIIPRMEELKFYKADEVWAHPDVEDDADLKDVAQGIYDIKLSSNSENSYFAEEYKKERKLQLVDNFNILYVAMTRPESGMHLIGSVGKTFVSDIDNPKKTVNFSNFAQILYWYVKSSKVDKGELHYEAKDEDKSDVIEMNSSYPSTPINPVISILDENGEQIDVREQGRLKFSTDSVDFFAEDGSAGAAASNRIRGIVLHDILSKVVVPSDLDEAVLAACLAGDISQDEAAHVKEILQKAIASVQDRGWFPEDGAKVLNETSLIDSDGEIYRPDRVVVLDEGLFDKTAIIIDYKFGEHRKSYERQIKKYADIYQRMGYHNPQTYLWYVDSGVII
jgi:ATP-dependent exoDNAse (exonuclease V) beta subunit